MKFVLFVLSMLFFIAGYSQENHAKSEKDSLNKKGLLYFKLREPAGYVLDKQEFTFSPQQNRIKITQLQGDKEIDFGSIRRTTDDGLYIMTSTINSNVSFGRFDSIGNFRTLRYDIEKDSVVEEYFRLKNIKQQ